MNYWRNHLAKARGETASEVPHLRVVRAGASLNRSPRGRGSRAAISTKEVKDLAVLMLDDSAEDPQLLEAATVLLMGIDRRKHVGDISRLTGIPKPRVKEIARNLRRSGIWGTEWDLNIYASGDWSGEQGVICFMLDVLCANGELEFTSE